MKTGKLNFKSLADTIITDLIRIQEPQAMAYWLEVAGGSILGRIGAALGFGGADSTISAGTCGGWANDFASYAVGGSFTVRGSGGTDSSDLGFDATPGETVTVTSPSSSAKSAGIIVNINAVDGESVRHLFMNNSNGPASAIRYRLRIGNGKL